MCGTTMKGRDSSFAIESGWEKGDEVRILRGRRCPGRYGQRSMSAPSNWIAPNSTREVSERDVGASGFDVSKVFR